MKGGIFINFRSFLFINYSQSIVFIRNKKQIKRKGFEVKLKNQNCFKFKTSQTFTKNFLKPFKLIDFVLIYIKT